MSFNSAKGVAEACDVDLVGSDFIWSTYVGEFHIRVCTLQNKGLLV